MVAAGSRVEASTNGNQTAPTTTRFMDTPP
jgi:hypothetical protein